MNASEWKAPLSFASDLEPGDLILVHSKGVVPGLIRFGECVRFHGWRFAFKVAFGLIELSEDDPCWASHIAVYIGNGQIIEATASGLQLSDVSKYGNQAVRIARLSAVKPNVTDQNRADAVAFAKAQLALHDKYGWLSIASIVVQLTTPSKLDLSWDGALICSAFGAQVWQTAGVIIPTRSTLITMPADLAAMVK